MRVQTPRHAGSHRVALVVRLLILITIATTSAAKSVTESADAARPQPLELDNTSLLHSSSSAANGKSSAGADTFCLYGGPGSLLGKFQTAAGQMDKQEWTSRDATEQAPNWHNSTFFSPTGTTAMWCGQSAEQQPGWDTAPGYGNGWFERLTYEETPLDPALGQVVSLSFVFNHDLELDYDFLTVEFERDNSFVQVAMVTGNSGGIARSFPQDVSIVNSIEYFGNDYNTDGKIRIRLSVTSDVAWSDEDGLYASNGAAQVDDIAVTTSAGTTVEDFEGIATLQRWKPTLPLYAGDFGKVFFRFQDIDPCRENSTPLIGFIDDGTPPNNASYSGTGTGGTVSPTWNYGIPGGWVFNYTGGISGGQLTVGNEWWSPEIEWDLPGSGDDGADVAGILFRADVYRHLPLYSIFFSWQVRARDAQSGIWGNWQDRGYVYYSTIPDWLRLERDVSDLLPAGVDRVQLLLGGIDLPFCDACPYNATPAPLFDNVSVYKYRIGGPTIVANEYDLFADTFASSGLTDVSTPAARDLLDCRVDMARSVSPAATPIRSGDSLVLRVTSSIPGTGISDPATQIRLHYSLDMNPAFEAAIRPNAAITQGGGGRFGWDQSEGTLNATQSVTTAGIPVATTYYFDLPDDGFLYPGDVLQYYIEAVDDDGRTSTLPLDLTGFDDPNSTLPYSRVFEVRALPSYQNAIGEQPNILFWNDSFNRGGDVAALRGLLELGYVEGIHFDSYATRAPALLVDNGLGATSPNGRGHGASLAQLSGYDCIVYEAGDLSSGLISSGSDNSVNDKGNDVGLLQSWFDAAADRYVVHFGDNLAWYLGGNPAQGASASASQLAYVSTVMGVTLSAPDVRASIEQQTAPQILALPTAPTFDADFVAFGGCPTINQFDSIAPASGAMAGHGFEVLSAPGTTYAIGPGRAASVVWDRMANIGGTDYRKVSVTFPFGMNYVYGSPAKGQATALGVLLSEVFEFFGSHVGGEVDAPPAATLQLYAPAPNPFNPRVQLRFETPFASRTQVQIFDLRGRLVRRLLDAELEAGRHELTWDGADDGGRAVASGVYVLRLSADGATQERKLALVR